MHLIHIPVSEKFTKMKTILTAVLAIISIGSIAQDRHFFPFNESLRIEAKFIKNQSPVPFQMKTTTERLLAYDKYGEAFFEFAGNKYKLSISQFHHVRQIEEYKNLLHLLFTDLTNGEDTYGGGRYIDLRIPSGDTIVIDFNKAHNPACAYDSTLSCPIPPKENDLNLRVEAGEKYLVHK